MQKVKYPTMPLWVNFLIITLAAKETPFHPNWWKTEMKKHLKCEHVEDMPKNFACFKSGQSEAVTKAKGGHCKY